MSHKATNWAIQQRGLSPAAKIVLWHLADRHNPDLGCFPTQEKLAQDCEMSRSSLNNHLKLLEERGLILREQRKDGSQRQAATWYRFAFEPEFDVLKAAQEPAETAQTDENRVQILDTEPCPKIGPSRVQNSGDSVSNCLDTEPVSKPVREPVTAVVFAREADLYASLGPFADQRANGRFMVLAEPINWLNSGCDLDLDVLPTIRSLVASSRSTITNWSYFSAAVFRARDRRLAPAPDIVPRSTFPPGRGQPRRGAASIAWEMAQEDLRRENDGTAENQ
jgi:DNA-binding transcriptional ArsR family regulator